ncbi:MAG: hypothetical protein AAF962_22440 [Actinomycetota bacterium]
MLHTAIRPSMTAYDDAINLDRLMADARWLWDREPAVPPDEREAVVTELFELVLALERLDLRSRWVPPDPGLTDDLIEASERIERLRPRWAPDD